MAEKTLALVLRTIDFSETSLVVTLFTREFGKLQALAKGARRPKGPFEAALDLLALCRIVFLRKSSDHLDLLTEAKLERRFRATSRGLPYLYAGYYVAELLRELTDEGDPHPELFDAADAVLLALEHGAQAVPSLVLHFELTALRQCGHLPALDQCVNCGAPVAATQRVAFALASGGVLCPRCRIGKQHVVSVSQSAMQLLQQHTVANLAAPDAKARPWGEVRAVMNQYLAHLLGFRPRMHRYLGSVC